VRKLDDALVFLVLIYNFYVIYSVMTKLYNV